MIRLKTLYCINISNNDMASHGVERGSKENHHVGVEAVYKCRGKLLVSMGASNNVDVVTVNEEHHSEEKVSHEMPVAKEDEEK